MKKEIEWMSDRELLMELVAEKRRNERLRVVRILVLSLALLALVILCLIWIPRITAPFRQLQETVDRLNESIARFDQASAQMTEAAEQVRSYLSNLGQSGYKALLRSVEEATAILEKLAGFLRIG